MRHYARIPLLFIAIGAVVIAGSGCAKKADTAASESPASTAALPAPNPALSGTLEIGAVLPLTGINATTGKDLQRGINLAVAKINADKGVLGKKLVVDIEDSQGQTTATVAAARKLVGVSKVPIVIGEYASGNTIPMQQYLQQNSVIGINPASTSIDLRKDGPLQFSVIGLDDKVSQFSANTLYERGFHKIAILAPNNAYGTGIAGSLAAAYTAKGGQVTSTEMYTEGQPDYRQELGRLSGGAPDAYAVTTYGKDGATINAEMFQLGMTGKPVFDIYMSEDVPDSDPKAVEGRTGMDVSSSTNSDYVAYYRHAYGEEFITTFNGFAYDAVYLAALAIEKAGATGPDALAVAIPAVAAGYTGVTGLLAVGPDGQRLSQSYALGTVKSGKIDFR